MPKDRRISRLRRIALGGLSLALVIESAGCSLLPARKVPPEPNIGGQTAPGPMPAGFGSQAPQTMNYGSGAPADSMPAFNSYGSPGMANVPNYGAGANMPATNPALGGMPAAADPALGQTGLMTGGAPSAGYAPSAGSGYTSQGGYAAPMLQDTAPPQSPYNMGTPGATPAPL